MSSGAERRLGARWITNLPVVLRPARGGRPLDDRATAHDISTAGFKLETQAELGKDAMIAFVLELSEDGRAAGLGRVIWSKRETFATWAGVKIIRMSRGDKRRLSRMLKPGTVDWPRLAGLLAKTVVAVTVVAAAHTLIFRRSEVLGVMIQLMPKFIALLLMAWALLGLLRRGERGG